LENSAAVLDLEVWVQQSFTDYGFIFFGLSFAAVTLWEAVFPVRVQAIRLTTRWGQHFALLIINLSIGKWLGHALGFLVAVEAAAIEFGALQWLPLEGPILWIASLILLDLKDYWFHRLKHWSPWLWQIHRVHHSDLEFDATTTFRFHPLETIINALVQVAAVALLGVPPTAIILYIFFGYLSGFFGHGNLSMPGGLDRTLRLITVTPDMHRIHHSASNNESNRNFGFLLTLWDRIFSSYQSEPQHPAATMDLGLAEYRLPKGLTLKDILILPFRSV